MLTASLSFYFPFHNYCRGVREDQYQRLSSHYLHPSQGHWRAGSAEHRQPLADGRRLLGVQILRRAAEGEGVEGTGGVLKRSRLVVCSGQVILIQMC